MSSDEPTGSRRDRASGTLTGAHPDAAHPAAPAVPQAAAGWCKGRRPLGLPATTGSSGGQPLVLLLARAPRDPDVEELDGRAAEALATRRWRRPRALGPRGAAGGGRQQPGAPRRGPRGKDGATSWPITCSGPSITSSPAGPAALRLDGGGPGAGALCEAAVGIGPGPAALVRALAGRTDAPTSAEALFDGSRRAPGGEARGGRVAPGCVRRGGRRGGGARRAARGLRLADIRQRPDRADPRRATGGDLAGIRAPAPGGPAEPAVSRGLPAPREPVPPTDRARSNELVARPRRRTATTRRTPPGSSRCPSGSSAGQCSKWGGDSRPRTDRGASTRARGRGGNSSALLAGRARGRDAWPSGPTARIGAALIPPPMSGSRPHLHRVRSSRQPPGPRPMLDAFHKVAWARPTDPAGQGDHGRPGGPGTSRGRADPTEAALRMEPGDVLVAVTTTAVYNTIFPMAAPSPWSTGGS